MRTIKTPIIPTHHTFAKVKGVHELNKEAICVFLAIGFFLDEDTYWRDQITLKPASIYTLDADGYIVDRKAWFQWFHSPKDITFEEALNEFTILFEKIVDEQVGDQKVILPLSGGLDSRSQATALKHLAKKVQGYSYDFKGGYPETKIAKKIAKTCDFDFKEYHIGKSYLWEVIEELARINQCYSEFTHPRQMAIIREFETMGDVFSLGHWGDVLFDKQTAERLDEEAQIDLLLKKVVKKGGAELASDLWDYWELGTDFNGYLRERFQTLLKEFDIENTSARIRAFKSYYWAPRWTSTNLSVFQEKRGVTLPFYDDRMCEFICTMPEEYLADRKLQLAYIKKRNKELGKITWQSQKPFNLYTFPKNKFPFNFPYRVWSKIKREGNAIFGNPYIQRNWELQFLGKENDEQLKRYLFGDELLALIPKEYVEKFYERFQKGDKIAYSHSVSMLLTLALKMKQIRDE